MILFLPLLQSLPWASAPEIFVLLLALCKHLIVSGAYPAVLRNQGKVLPKASQLSS